MSLAQLVQEGITEKNRNHLEPATAPPDWWNGLGDIVPWVLLTIGEKECFYDQDMDLSRSLEPHTRVQTVVQPNGVHVDPIFAFGAGHPGEGAGDDYKAVVSFLKSVFE